MSAYAIEPARGHTRLPAEFNFATIRPGQYLTPLSLSTTVKKGNRKYIISITMMLKIHTSISRQAALSRVIWSAMVKLVKPGNRFANSTILIMHFVASSLNLSQSPRSSRTR